MFLSREAVTLPSLCVLLCAGEFKRTCADYIKAVFSMPGAITDQEVGPQAAKEQVSVAEMIAKPRPEIAAAQQAGSTPGEQAGHPPLEALLRLRLRCRTPRVGVLPAISGRQ